MAVYAFLVDHPRTLTHAHFGSIGDLQVQRMRDGDASLCDGRSFAGTQRSTRVMLFRFGWRRRRRSDRIRSSHNGYIGSDGELLLSGTSAAQRFDLLLSDAAVIGAANAAGCADKAQHGGVCASSVGRFAADFCAAALSNPASYCKYGSTAFATVSLHLGDLVRTVSQSAARLAMACHALSLSTVRSFNIDHSNTP